MPIALRVYFPDSSSRSLIMDSATTASELVRQIGRKLDADAQLWTGFGIYIETDDFGAHPLLRPLGRFGPQSPDGRWVHAVRVGRSGPLRWRCAERSIPNKSHLFDAMAESNIQPTNCRLVFKKRLWLPREDWASDSFTSLLYHQVRHLQGRALPVGGVCANRWYVAVGHGGGGGTRAACSCCPCTCAGCCAARSWTPTSACTRSPSSLRCSTRRAARTSGGRRTMGACVLDRGA